MTSALLGFLAAGCGGSGSSIDSGPIAGTSNTNAVNNGPNSGDVGLFVTDSFSDKFDHVWVSIKKVELKLAAGGTREIFADPQGVGVDLSSLRDESGPKYQFLNQLTMPAGTYTGAVITLDKNAVLFPTNTTTGHPEEFASQADGAKEAVLNVAFDPPKMLGTGHDDLVLDFDLSKWKDNGGKLTAVVTTSMGAGLEAADRNREVVEEGVVNALKGDVPQQTFTLKNGKSTAIEVQTSASTALIGIAGAPSPQLTKGQSVEVSGVFDTNTRRMSAAAIKVVDPKAPASPEVEGVVSAIDLKNGTWNVTPSLTRGVLPLGIAIPVSISTDAHLTSPSGLSVSREDFLQGLSGAKDVSVLVTGAYDPVKNTLSATDARRENADSQPAVKVAGVVSNPKADAQTFSLIVTDYEGLLTKPGAAEVVSVTPTTTYADLAGKALTPQQFFVGLASPTAAQISGVLDTSSGNVVANSVKLAPAPAPPQAAAKKPKR